MPRLHTLLFAGLLAASTHALAWNAPDLEEERPWRETASELPPFPRPQALIGFEVSAASRNRHFLDRDSIRVGEDGVVRYTVLIRTPGGAENLRFEGIRCATGEQKSYAFGQDGRWVLNRNARWEPIRARAAGSYQRELFSSYFCAGGMGEPDLPRILRLLQEGGWRPD